MRWSSGLFILAVTAVILCFGGCAYLDPGNSLSMSIDSIATPDARALKTYQILPGELAPVPQEPLQRAEFQAELERSLQAQGFSPARSKDSAELLINFTVMEHEPHESRGTVSMPVYGTTGGGVSSFNATSYGSNGFVNTYGTVSSPIQYGVVGQRTMETSTLFVPVTLGVEAVDLQESKKHNKLKRVWYTFVTCIAHKSDLRRIVPRMMTVAAPYYGINTKGKVQKSASLR